MSIYKLACVYCSHINDVIGTIVLFLFHYHKYDYRKRSQNWQGVQRLARKCDDVISLRSRGSDHEPLCIPYKSDDFIVNLRKNKAERWKWKKKPRQLQLHIVLNVSSDKRCMFMQWLMWYLIWKIACLSEKVRILYCSIWILNKNQQQAVSRPLLERQWVGKRVD